MFWSNRVGRYHRARLLELAAFIVRPLLAGVVSEEHFVLDGIGHNEPHHSELLRLAQAVSSSDCLSLNRSVQCSNVWYSVSVLVLMDGSV